jgi:SprT protein
MQTILIDKTQQEQVIAATHSCIQHAEQLLECELPPLPVAFDLKGRAAGMYRVRNEQRQIRYNPYIFGKYFDDNLANTVPHEVAHYITDMLHGIRNVRPHGTEWQAVMHKLGAEPSVTCHYNLEGIPLRRQRRFSYRCACSSHTISTVRHNRVQRGFGNYVCKRCCKPLVFTG